ncbi:MAG: glutamine-hydrolyzing carbamoyl-phosphate synthase small subunit, partial [Candidatus Puniceispirillaceae bacterium]
MPDAVYDVKTLTPFSPPSAATAILLLEDGTAFYGTGFGAETTNVGEICFNTSMTGYQEIMTDPSYAGQIITFTFPHIGNTGTNGDDVETIQPAALGMIVRNDVTQPSNWRQDSHLHSWLKQHGLPGISGIDTRALTRTIRDNGAPKGVLCHRADGQFDLPALQKLVADWPGLKGMDLASVVSTKKDFTWSTGSFDLETNSAPDRKEGLHVVAMDFGCKQNILRCLVDAGCIVDVVSASASADDILARKPDGIFLANGPGDPAATAEFAVPEIKQLIDSNVPIFGICIGHQLLALAMGGSTGKMARGHRGANHPVRDLT